MYNLYNCYFYNLEQDRAQKIMKAEKDLNEFKKSLSELNYRDRQAFLQANSMILLFEMLNMPQQ